jgi:hypothetical protein
MAAPNPQRQRVAKQRVAQLFAQPSTVYVVHYACQSFRTPDSQGSPRVAAIAVRNLDSGQTISFSIHQELELAGVPVRAAVQYMDRLERAMLDRYFAFLSHDKGMRFVHWNMRDLTFGFTALEHRYARLGGNPYILHEHQRCDLAIVTADVYGTEYLPRPHLKSLAQKNGISLAGFLEGAEEPDAFDRGLYFAVLQSTQCKVTIVADCCHRLHDNTLVTNASKWTRNVGMIREAAQLFENNPVKAYAGLVFGGLSAGFAMFFKWLV